VLEQNYVGKSVNHRCPKLLMDSTKGVGAICDHRNTITNRSPKAITEVNGYFVVIRDGGRKIFRNERVITRVLAIDAPPKFVIVDCYRRVGFQLSGST
jgi:hypothetical protein